MPFGVKRYLLLQLPSSNEICPFGQNKEMSFTLIWFSLVTNITLIRWIACCPCISSRDSKSTLTRKVSLLSTTTWSSIESYKGNEDREKWNRSRLAINLLVHNMLFSRNLVHNDECFKQTYWWEFEFGL